MELLRAQLARFMRYLNAHPRFAYFCEHGVWVWLGIACVLFGIGNFLDPHQLSGEIIQGTMHPYDHVWNLGYILGGGLMSYGILRGKVEWEYLGLQLFTFAFFLYSIAYIAILGFTIGSITYPALAVAALMRALILLARAWAIEIRKNGDR